MIPITTTPSIKSSLFETSHSQPRPIRNASNPRLNSTEFTEVSQLYNKRINSEESLLSKSLNHATGLNASLHRRNAETTSSIKYAGYLYKRSNHPCNLGTDGSQLQAHDSFTNLPIPIIPRNNSNIASPRPIPIGNLTIPSLLPVVTPNTPDNGESVNIDSTYYDHFSNRSTIRKNRHVRPTLLTTENIDIPTPSPTSATTYHTPLNEIITTNQITLPTHEDGTLEKNLENYLKENDCNSVIEVLFGISDLKKSIEKYPEPPLTPPSYRSRASLTPHTEVIDISPRRDNTKKTVPIAIQPNENSSYSNLMDKSQNMRMINRQETLPSSNKSSYPPPPEGYIDPKDGHYWRAKYCILEQGILYFYRNAEEGNSHEAQKERDQISLFRNSEGNDGNVTTYGTTSRGGNNGNHGYNNHNNYAYDFDHLAKSPMPRNRINNFLYDTNDNDIGISTSISNCVDPNVLWEKRVAMDKVGSVRSTEVDYGKCTFELIAIDSGGGGGDESGDPETGNDESIDENAPLLSVADNLILRAETVDEMNNWIFEIHRSLNLLIKKILNNLVETTTTDVSEKGPTGGMMYGTFQANEFLARYAGARPVGNTLISPGKNRTGTSNGSPNFPAIALSHGHGRSAHHRHRRRKSGSSSPSSGLQSLTVSKTDDSIHQSRQDLENDINQTGRENDSAIHSSISIQQDDLRRSTSTKYIPPHLRVENQQQLSENNSSSTSGNSKNIASKIVCQEDSDQNIAEDAQTDSIETDTETRPSSLPQHKKLGGCADVTLAKGSICDEIYIKDRKASSVGKVSSKPYGVHSNASWEIGAVSDCGIRNSNEDAYLIISDLQLEAEATRKGLDFFLPNTRNGLFAIFDGHCGNHTARFAAEKFSDILFDQCQKMDSNIGTTTVEKAQWLLQSSLSRLDKDFCELSMSDKREWESGATALIALIIGDSLTIASLGDCNGVLCCSASKNSHTVSYDQDWSILEHDENDILSNSSNKNVSGVADRSSPIRPYDIIWKEVADKHCPSRDDERERIQAANGWITTETEIPIAQFQRQNLHDAEVLTILKKCFSDRYTQNVDRCGSSKKGHSDSGRILTIYRVCGELAVSRALGDREFKVAFNLEDAVENYDGRDLSEVEWTTKLFLPFPEHHTEKFRGDLVSSVPDITCFDIGKYGTDEFLLLACDGLWDVMDADDAVRITRNLLYEGGRSAKEAAERLADLAIKLGSSDNITVIVIRFDGMS